MSHLILGRCSNIYKTYSKCKCSNIKVFVTSEKKTLKHRSKVWNLFKINNKDIQYFCSDAIIAKFEQILHLVLSFNFDQAFADLVCHTDINLVDVYSFEVNNKNKNRCENCSKLTTETPELKFCGWLWTIFTPWFVFVTNFEQVNAGSCFNISIHRCSQHMLLLTLSWWKPLSYRNQSIDLLCKAMDWFLYDIVLRHERGKC